MKALVLASLLDWLFGAQEPRVQDGNARYAKGDYQKSLDAYDAALGENPPSPELHFDRGDALYKLGKPDEAGEEFKKALDTRDPAFKARDYFNLGNAWLQQKKLPEAIESYRRSLELDPSDQGAKHNLELALQSQKQQKDSKDGQGDKKDDKGGESKKDDKKSEDKKDQQQSKNDKKDDKKDQGKPDQPGQKDGGEDQQQAKEDQPKDDKPDGGSEPQQAKQDQDQKQKDKAEQQKKDEQQKAEGQPKPEPSGGDEKESEAENEPAGQAGQPKALSKKDAERILDAMKASEKQLQMWQLQAKERHPRSAEKDW